MEKFKSHLLTALGVAVVMLTIMLFTSRTAVTQTSTTTNKKPWQNNFVLPSITVKPFEIGISSQTWTVPAGRILQIETVGLVYVPGINFNWPETQSVFIETTTGGVTSITETSLLDGNTFHSGHFPLHVYADPGTVVTVRAYYFNGNSEVSQRSITAPTVTLHGLLVKPAYL